MWNEPPEDQLQQLPCLNETDNITIKDKLIVMHFYLFCSHWYAVEFDGDDQFFGFVIINGDHWNSEWGYFSFKHLKEISIKGVEISHDVKWEPKKASEVPGIKT